MATITLAYGINLGLQDPTNFATAFGNISIADVIDYLQMTINSDMTVVGSPGLVRTIVLATTPESDLSFPTDADKIAATTNLFTGTLSQAGPVPALVTANNPVVT